MVKSEWLPTMPLHVAIWSQIVMEAELSWADQGKTIRLLANAWSSGELSRKPWASDDAWRSAERMWPEMLAERNKNLRTKDTNSVRAKAAAEARWKDAPPVPADAPSNAPSMLQACVEHPPSNAQSMLQACVEHPPSNAQSMEQEQKQEQEQEQEQDQEQKALSLRSRETPSRRVPDGFELSKDRFEYALERGLTVEDAGEEFEAFLDHRFKTPKTKWDLAWKAWVRKAVQIRGLGSSRRTQPQTAAQRSMETAEEFGREAGVL